MNFGGGGPMPRLALNTRAARLDSHSVIGMPHIHLAKFRLAHLHEAVPTYISNNLGNIHTVYKPHQSINRRHLWLLNELYYDVITHYHQKRRLMGGGKFTEQLHLCMSRRVQSVEKK